MVLRVSGRIRAEELETLWELLGREKAGVVIDLKLGDSRRSRRRDLSCPQRNQRDRTQELSGLYTWVG